MFSGAVPAWLFWPVLGVLVIVLWKLIDRRVDKLQRKALELAKALNKLGQDVLAAPFESFAIDANEDFVAEISALVKRLQQDPAGVILVGMRKSLLDSDFTGDKKVAPQLGPIFAEAIPTLVKADPNQYAPLKEAIDSVAPAESK